MPATQTALWLVVVMDTTDFTKPRRMRPCGNVELNCDYAFNEKCLHRLQFKLHD